MYIKATKYSGKVDDPGTKFSISPYGTITNWNTYFHIFLAVLDATYFCIIHCQICKLQCPKLKGHLNLLHLPMASFAECR